jgi:hypothetical protein
MHNTLSRNLLGPLILTPLVGYMGDVGATTCGYTTPLGTNVCFPSPRSAWSTATPESKGMTASGLKSFSDYVGSYGIVIKDGYKIHSWGTPPSQIGLGSATKSVFGLVFARLKQDGQLSDGTTLASQGWPMRGGIDNDTAITMKQLINMNGSYAVQGSEAPGTRTAYNDYNVNLFWKTLWNKTKSRYGQNLNAYAMSKFGSAIGLADVFTSAGKTYGSPEPDADYLIGTGPSTCAGLSARYGCGIHTNLTMDEFGRLGWFYANSGDWGGSGQLIAASYFPTVSSGDGDPPSTVVGAAGPNGDNGDGGTGPYPDVSKDYLRVGTFGGPANSQRPQPQSMSWSYAYGFTMNKSAYVGSCGSRKSVNWREAPHIDTFMVSGGSATSYVVLIVSRAHRLVVAFKTTIREFRNHLVGNLTTPQSVAMKKLRLAFANPPPQLPTCY